MKGKHLNVTKDDVVVISVCYGNDCTTYYSGHRLLVMITEVDFQVNSPKGVNVKDLFSYMVTDSFLRSVEVSLSKALGRVIAAAYVSVPEEVIEAASGSSLGFKATAGKIPKNDEEILIPITIPFFSYQCGR